MLNSGQEVLQITKELVKVQSVVNTPGEQDVADFIYQMLYSLPYFQEHTAYLKKVRTLNDHQKRSNVLGLVEGTKQETNRTIILMGHMDTVGIEDFHHLQDLACDPDHLMEALKSEELPEAVKDQLDSNEWLFGRGVLDMKSGVASHLHLIRYYAEHPEELAGNLVLIAECDEEDSSHGILSALKDLKDWKEQYQLDYIAAINADFVSTRYEGDENRYVYQGTVGKLLPSFFITGVETHVGSCFDGLDPNFIAAELTRLIDYNPDLCNEAYGETTVPPVSLKQTDLKPSYTVQTALSAYVYYNFFIHSWSPKEVLIKLKEIAQQAFSQALSLYEQRYRVYCQQTGETYKDIPWNSRVYTYEEFHALLMEMHGDTYVRHMEEFKKQLLEDDRLDTRMYSARVVEEAWKWMRDQSPAIILFYSSLYSPRIELTGKNDKERQLMESLQSAVEKVRPHYPHPIMIRNFFPYISDMSFVALSDDQEGIQAVCTNNPSWGEKHFVNFQDIRDINVPVINIGPYGYDAHKRYERMEIKFSTEVVPNLTNEVILNLFAK